MRPLWGHKLPLAPKGKTEMTAQTVIVAVRMKKGECVQLMRMMKRKQWFEPFP
jgi:hypothetical protein